jgi:RimJ/RimL family protein N-acetyltransferase
MHDRSGSEVPTRRHITFRPLTRDDLTLLEEWLARPHVAEWWGGPSTRQEVEEDYAPVIDSEGPHRAYIALEGKREIGFIQSYHVVSSHADGWWLDEHEAGVFGIDQFLANAEDLGRGLGTAMVNAFLVKLFSDTAVTRVQTDPDPQNARAIRCYEKAGFHAQREVTTLDGPALLMYAERTR